MSLVTNVILQISVLENVEAALEKLNAEFFGEYGNLRNISGVENHWGGRKQPEVELLAGAFNYLDQNAMADYLRQFPFRYPHLLLVCEQADDVFQIIDLT